MTGIGVIPWFRSTGWAVRGVKSAQDDHCPGAAAPGGPGGRLEPISMKEAESAGPERHPTPDGRSAPQNRRRGRARAALRRLGLVGHCWQKRAFFAAAADVVASGAPARSTPFSYSSLSRASPCSTGQRPAASPAQGAGDAARRDRLPPGDARRAWVLPVLVGRRALRGRGAALLPRGRPRSRHRGVLLPEDRRRPGRLRHALPHPPYEGRRQPVLAGSGTDRYRPPRHRRLPVPRRVADRLRQHRARLLPAAGPAPGGADVDLLGEGQPLGAGAGAAGLWAGCCSRTRLRGGACPPSRSHRPCGPFPTAAAALPAHGPAARLDHRHPHHPPPRRCPPTGRPAGAAEDPEER